MKQPHLYVTGFAEDGTSTWASDRDLKAEVSETLWDISKVPVSMDEDGSAADQGLMPPPQGVSFKYVVLKAGTGINQPAGAPPPWHETDTIDFVTMISGEVWCAVDGSPKEVLLRSGDTLIQRGTLHGWYNRGTEPAIFTATLVSSHRTDRTPQTRKRDVRTYRPRAKP